MRGWDTDFWETNILTLINCDAKQKSMFWKFIASHREVGSRREHLSAKIRVLTLSADKLLMEIFGFQYIYNERTLGDLQAATVLSIAVKRQSPANLSPGQQNPGSVRKVRYNAEAVVINFSYKQSPGLKVTLYFASSQRLIKTWAWITYPLLISQHQQSNSNYIPVTTSIITYSEPNGYIALS